MSARRFTRKYPCPICGGHRDLPQGQGRRCYGYQVDDQYARCTREELAGDIKPNEDGTYSHRLGGPCRCGKEHAPAASELREVRFEIRDENGKLLAIHIRRENPATGKKVGPMPWLRPGNRRGLGGDGEVDRLHTTDMLYGLELLASEAKDELVALVEGENAAKALRRLGLLTVGTVCGAGHTPSATVLRKLGGRPVVLWPDNDDDGRRHMDRIAQVLQGLGTCEVSILQWPDAPEHGDAADLAAAGGTISDVYALLQASTLLSPPTAPEPVLTPVAAKAPHTNGSTPKPAARLDLSWLPPTVAAVCDDLSSTWKQASDAHVTAALATLLVAVGANVQLIFPGGDDAPALDWFVLVGNSGSGKTPIMRALLAPLRQRQREMDEEYRLAIKAWRKATRAGGLEAQAAGEKPATRTLIYDDTTFEAMTVALADAQDTGAVWFGDELLGLFNSLDSYKARGGRSLQGLLTMWRAEPIRRQRVKDAELTIVPRPVLSILGGVQPSKIHELGSNDDGRLSRMLPVKVDMGADAAERDPDPGLVRAWHDLVLAVLDSRPATLTTLGLEADAAELWRERSALTRMDARALPEQEQDVVLPFVAKLEQHVARLCLALWAGIHGRADGLPELNRQVVADAWALGEWYLQQQLAIFAETALSMGQRPFEVEQAAAANRFHQWLTGRFEPPVTRRSVQMAASRWLRGGKFLATVDEWRRKGYGLVTTEGRSILLSWETEPSEAVPESPK